MTTSPASHKIQSTSSERARPNPGAHESQPLAHLYALTAALVDGDSPAQVAAATIAHTLAALNAQSCVVWLLNRPAATLDELGSESPPPETGEALRRIELEHAGPLAAAMDTVEPRFFSSGAELAAAHPAFAPGALGASVQACAVLPLRAKGSPFGALTVAFAEPQAFDEGRRELLATIAGQCALALDRARLASAAAENAQARERFIALAAHDLRTPLTVLLGQAQVMERRLAAQQAGDQLLRGAELIVQQSSRMSRMISALLDLSRLDGGHLVIQREPVALRPLVERVVAETQSTTNRHHLAVVCDHENLQVLGDEARLEQVVQNLLNNALRFSPAGGHVTIRLGGDPDTVRVAVSDNGIGIPAEALPRLFERFYRGPSMSGRPSGQGLGLYVVRELVALHNGTVTAESDGEQGSTFTVSLPAYQKRGA
jgi:signal transduction histidine kinase